MSRAFLLLRTSLLFLFACESPAPVVQEGTVNEGAGGSTAVAGKGGSAGTSANAGTRASAGTNAGTGGAGGGGGAGAVGGGAATAGSGGGGAAGAGTGGGGMSGSSGQAGAAMVPCNQDPFECNPGHTCWWTSPDGSTFACLPSAPGKPKGACCENTLASPTCGDWQMCYGSSLHQPSRCISYCDPKGSEHGCDPGETCTELYYSPGKPSFYVCIPDMWPSTCK